MSRKKTSPARGFCAIALSLAMPATVHAHEPPSGLLAHLPFDGALADATGNGFTADMVGADASAPPGPQFVEGKFGRAIAFDGERSVRIPLDLHYDRYPAVTITGWLYLQNEDSRGALVGTGSGDGPQIRINGDDIFASHANGRNQANGALRPGRWFFFAGSWDYRSGTNRLSWRARSQTEPFETAELDPPAQDLWLGSIAELQTAAEALAIDDVRVYDRVLTDEELEGLQLGPDEERISGTGSPGLIGGGPDVAGIADQADVDATGASSGDGGAVLAGGQVIIDPALLEGLSADEATDLQQEFEQLVASYSDSGSEGTDGSASSGRIDAELAAELAGESDYDSFGVFSEGAGEDSSDGTETETATSQNGPGDDDGNGSDEPPPGGTGWRFSATDVTRTAVSGAAGEIVIPGERSDGLHSINIIEKSDVPCEIFYNDYLHSQECETLSPTEEELEVHIGSGTISALAVCSNDRSNQRVKGIEVRGNDIEADGSIGSYWQDEDELLNCRQWESLVLCPTGYLATGLVGHFNPRRFGSNELIGLQLICRRVVPE